MLCVHGVCPSTTNLRHGRHFKHCHRHWQPNSLKWTTNNVNYQGLIAVDLVRQIGCHARIKHWRMRLTDSCLLKLVILSEDTAGAGAGGASNSGSTLRHFTEKASVSAFMNPDQRGMAEVDMDQMEEMIEVEKGNIVAIVQLNSTSSSNCLCFAPSRRGGKLWSALHHGHIESGPVSTYAPSPTLSDDAIENRNDVIENRNDVIENRNDIIESRNDVIENSNDIIRHPNDSEQAVGFEEAVDPRPADAVRRQKRQAGSTGGGSAGSIGGDVFLLQAQIGRLSWGLTLDTTQGSGDLESRFIDFFGDDSDMSMSARPSATTAAGSSANTSSAQPSSVSETTSAPTPNQQQQASDSIIISSYVSERVFGLTGSMQLIFDLTSLQAATTTSQSDVLDDIAFPTTPTMTSSTPSTPQSEVTAAEVQAGVTPTDQHTTDITGRPITTTLPDDTEYDVLPIVIAVVVLLVLAFAVLIVFLAIRWRHRQRVSRKVYSRHIVNSTAASMERQRRKHVLSKRKRTGRQRGSRREIGAPLECIRVQSGTPAFITASVSARNQFRDAHDALTVRHTVHCESEVTDGRDIYSTNAQAVYNSQQQHQGGSGQAANSRVRRPQRSETFERPNPATIPDPPPPSIPASRVSIRVHVAKEPEHDMTEVESLHTLARPQLSDIPERDSRAVSEQLRVGTPAAQSGSVHNTVYRKSQLSAQYSSSSQPPLNSMYLNHPQQYPRNSHHSGTNEYDDAMHTGNNSTFSSATPDEIFGQEESEIDTEWDTDPEPDMAETMLSPFNALGGEDAHFPPPPPPPTSQGFDAAGAPVTIMSSHVVATPQYSNTTLVSDLPSTNSTMSKNNNNDTYYSNNNNSGDRLVSDSSYAVSAQLPNNMQPGYQESHYHSSKVAASPHTATNNIGVDFPRAVAMHLDADHHMPAESRHSHYHSTDISLGSLSDLALGAASGHVISAETRARSMSTGARRDAGGLDADAVHLYTLPSQRRQTRTAPLKPKRRASSVRATSTSLPNKHMHCQRRRRKSNGAVLDADESTMDVSSAAVSSTQTMDKLMVQFRRHETGEVRTHQYALTEPDT
ncbi:uncharacterized protein LOC135825061 [Sycon ciliatum]|uniref:uncharacterized protein LOC135825061 n=1 Tax=Sycon ciliatum TaxID=27933 RepID=UPI0031F6AA80